MTKRQGTIFGEIVEERNRQDRQWGGPDHDDFHDERDWLRYIRKQMAHAWRAAPLVGELMTDYRRRLVKIAALALAAIESHDRRQEGDRLIREVLADVRAQLQDGDPVQVAALLTAEQRAALKESCYSPSRSADVTRLVAQQLNASRSQRL